MSVEVNAEEIDPSRQATDDDADQLRANAEKKYGQDGNLIRKLDPEYYGDGY